MVDNVEKPKPKPLDVFLGLVLLVLGFCAVWWVSSFAISGLGSLHAKYTAPAPIQTDGKRGMDLLNAYTNTFPDPDAAGHSLARAMTNWGEYFDWDSGDRWEPVLKLMVEENHQALAAPIFECMIKLKKGEPSLEIDHAMASCFFAAKVQRESR